MTKRILIADDEPAVRELLEVELASQGYEVLIAQDGDQAVRVAQEHSPDLVLVDLMKLHLDDYETLRQLRNDIRTACLPIIILSTRATPEDIAAGLDAGADDYVTKPFNTLELLARIERRLCHMAQQSLRNPLTQLPGDVLLAEELKYRLKQLEPFTLLDVDLDNFKAFNDTYSPARGDRMIWLLAKVLVEQVQEHGTGGDFISHIGGDDFAVITSPDVLDNLCRNIIDAFDKQVRTLYNPEDLARGYLQGINRQGMSCHFPLISLSIGGVSSHDRPFTDYADMCRVAAEMKQSAKQQSNSSYDVDGRRELEAPVGTCYRRWY